MSALRLVGAAAMSAALTGCAMFGGGSLDESSPGVMRGGGSAAAQAHALVHPGASTKAEVAAALGRANTIPFDSGYEVWVYRWLGADRTPRAASELVILFDRNGIARKARIRPGYSA